MPSTTFTLRVDGALAEFDVTPATISSSVGALLEEDVSRMASILDERPDVLCVLLSLGGSVPTNAGAQRTGSAFRTLELIPQPAIAVIEGPCEGSLLELALACDLRVASSAATFTMQQVPAGELPRHGGTQRLSRLIGRARATQMILLGETIDTSTALAWGLINHATHPQVARARAREIAASICTRGPLALRFAKEAILRGLDMPLEQALRYETDLTVILQITADRGEGVRAFLEKRQPKFEGN